MIDESIQNVMRKFVEADAGEDYVSPETIDALRGGLGDNPCVLLDNEDGVYHFSNKDLERAFRLALAEHYKVIESKFESIAST
jgi:hypothetical protein